MSYSLDSLKGSYGGFERGLLKGLITKLDTRTLDYGSCRQWQI